MNESTRKLAHLLGDAELAQALAESGLDTPAKIKAAGDKELEAIPGIGKATRQKIRARLPKVRA